MNETNLIDNFGRKINYLRLSVTDRCNLRCFYCDTCRNYRFIPHKNILRYEEMLDLIQVSQSLDIGKVRLTGGEPFVRKDLDKFIYKIFERYPNLDLRITTNGTLLKKYVPVLKETGLKRINISLDTLDRNKFQRITKRDFYVAVRESIEECLKAEIGVKINTVAMKNVNDDELPGFLSFTWNNPVDVRFIEYMPIGMGSEQNDLFWSTEDILASLQKMVELKPLEIRKDNQGPARMYDLVGGQGRFGFISPMSNHFCALCNRFRITANGRLRTCLFSDKSYALRPLLRSKKLGLDKLKQVMYLASLRKPMGYKLLEQNKKHICDSRMSSIGG